MDKEKWKVLIIDDEEGIRKVMSITLSDEGYEVFSAEDGKNGIELCKEKSPQIVIVDVRMPGMNGIEVLEKLKEEDPEVEVILITGFGDIEYAIRALQLNASDFITKPVNDDVLFVAIERAKERYTTHRELKNYTTLMEERWLDTAEELARTFNFQNNLIDSSIDGIIGCDEAWKVVSFNRSAKEILGYTKEDVIKKMSFGDFFSDEEKKFRDYLNSDDYGGKNRLFLFETTLLNKAGIKVPVQLSATVLFEENEETGLVVILRDLREIRRLEQEFADQARLLQQDKMISLGKLAASIVHEINNPLAGILNYMRLMIKITNRGALDEEIVEKFKRYLSLAESETDRCSKIVSNLLAFSRKSELESGQVNINELLEKCIMLSQHKLTLQNIQVRTHLDPSIQSVLGDYNQIQQCVINLIFNAIDAMPNGGILTLKSLTSTGKEIVKIIVEDTGSGISEEDLPHIFEPFYTTKVQGKGVGLGLSTVYGIVDRHKGTITASTELKKGTVFTITLPAES